MTQNTPTNNLERLTNFQKVSCMNEAFGNKKGDPKNIDIQRVRNQSVNILDEFIELMKAQGLDEEALEKLKYARSGITPSSWTDTFDLDKTRDALCDVNVFSYGAHHLMGIDADRDMDAVVTGVMSRFIKDDEDKRLTSAVHAARGVAMVYFEGEYPAMVMKSLVDQPDSPKGKFLKSASYSEPVFYEV